LCFAPPNRCRDTQHPTWRTKEERLFSGDQVVGSWEAEACKPPGVLLRYSGGLCSMSRLICMMFLADVIACRLDFSLSAVACRPVTPRLWGGFFARLL